MAEVNFNLFDMAGRMMPFSSQTVGKTSSINFSELSNGVYFLEVNHRSTKQYFKLVKQ